VKPQLTEKTSQPLLSRLLSIHATIFALFFSIVWFSTSGQGIGTTPDSALFLSTASSLRNNLNLEDYTGKASSLAPPMYPALIAGVSVLTIRDTRFGAPRLLAGLTFGLLGVFTFLSLWLLTKSEVFSAIGCVAVASSHTLVKLGSLAGSDITFLTCSILGGMFFLVATSTRKNAWLWASAALFSLGCLTRYVGVIWPSIAICFLLFGGLEASPRLRFMRAFRFGLIAFTPVFVWMAAWGLAEKTVGGRLFNWHPVDWEKIQQGIIVAGKAVGTHGSNVG